MYWRMMRWEEGEGVEERGGIEEREGAEGDEERGGIEDDKEKEGGGAEGKEEVVAADLIAIYRR